MFVMVMYATQATYSDRSSGTTFSHWEVATAALGACIYTHCTDSCSITLLWTSMPLSRWQLIRYCMALQESKAIAMTTDELVREEVLLHTGWQHTIYCCHCDGTPGDCVYPGSLDALPSPINLVQRL